MQWRIDRQTSITKPFKLAEQLSLDNRDPFALFTTTAFVSLNEHLLHTIFGRARSYEVVFVRILLMAADYLMKLFPETHSMSNVAVLLATKVGSKETNCACV